MRYYVQRNSHKIIRTFLFLLVLVGIVGGAKYFIASNGETSKLNDRQTPTTVSDTSPASVSSRVLLMGNINWGGHMNDLSRASDLGTAYPFSDLNMFSRNEFEAWVGNLMCSLSDVQPVAGSDTSCPSEYIAEAKKWFNVFSIGSQSSDEVESSAKTKQVLTAANIQYVGSRDTSETGELCDIIALPARFTLGDGSFKTAQLPLAMCAVNIRNQAPDATQQDIVAKYAKILPVIVYTYMNDSNSIGQSEYQKLAYRSLIDAGADMIIGNHPYAVQGAESYKGKLIVYSLGNFIYAGKSEDPEYYQGIGIKTVITSDTDSNMLSWADLAKECGKALDTCIARAKEKDLTRPTYSYDLLLLAVESSKENIVMKSEGTWREQAPKRLGWEALLPSLKYTTKQ